MSSTKNDQLIRLVPQRGFPLEVASFLLDRKARGLSPRTLEFYHCELRRLGTFLEESQVSDVRDISADHIRRYLVHLGRSRNAGGVHAAYRAVKVFLRWWDDETEPRNWVNPIQKVRPPKLKQEPLEPVSLIDLKCMLATCQRRTFTGDRDRVILLALLDTGCRASEFVSLNLQDVDLATGAAIVRHGKGGKHRVTFLGTKAQRALLRYLRHRPGVEVADPLWATEPGSRLSYWGLRQVIRRRAVKARVPVPSLHSFRRAFALLSLRSGADLISLQRLLGHSDLSVLRRYLNQTHDDLRATHEKHGPVDHWL